MDHTQVIYTGLTALIISISKSVLCNHDMISSKNQQSVVSGFRNKFESMNWTNVCLHITLQTMIPMSFMMVVMAACNSAYVSFFMYPEKN